MAHLSALRQVLYRPVTLVLVVVLAIGLSTTLIHAQGSQLLNRSLKLSDNRAGATGTYDFSFQPAGLDLIQMVVLQICANDPFPNTPCTAPTGFDASGATLASQTGDIGFSISTDSTANVIVLNRSPFSSSGQQDSYTFTNVVNPTSNGSYYVRILTYSDSNTSVGANNYGGLAFAIASGISVQAIVPPYLLFCTGVTITGYDCKNVAGDHVDFGEFGSRQVSQGSTQMLAATNAKDGYGIYVAGTTLTSGNNVIPNLVGLDISRPGVSQFGMNLRANSSPQGGTDPTGAGNGLPTNGYNQINFYRFNSGDMVAISNKPDEARKYTATYIVNVAKNQAPGVYVSTLTYVGIGSF